MRVSSVGESINAADDMIKDRSRQPAARHTAEVGHIVRTSQIGHASRPPLRLQPSGIIADINEAAA